MCKKVAEFGALCFGLEVLTLMGCIPVVAPKNGSWADLPASVWIFIALFGIGIIAGMVALAFMVSAEKRIKVERVSNELYHGYLVRE